MTQSLEKLMQSPHPAYPVAGLEDLRPGAKVLLQTGSAEQTYAREVEITSFPYRQRPDAPKEDLALESTWVSYNNGKDGSANEGFFLCDYGLVPYSSGHVNLNHQVLLKEPAPDDISLQQALVDALSRYMASVIDSRNKQ